MTIMLNNFFLKKKGFIINLVLFLLISIFIKIFFLRNSYFSNDDEAYINIGENIFNLGIISSDGESIHTLFPPLYPVLLKIQKFFFNSYYEVLFFQYILTNTILAFIAGFVGTAYFKSQKYIFFVLLIHPVFSISRITITISSELWFSVFIWSGIVLLFLQMKKDHFFYLFFANILFSLSYLIRPEGLAFFSSSFLVFLFQYVKIYQKKIFSFANIQMFFGKIIRKQFFISFILPIAFIVLPYTIFLFYNTDELTLSGKISVNNYIFYENEAIYSKLTHFISNFISFLDILFSSPFFLTPLINFGIILFIIINIFFKHNFLSINYLIFLLPLTLISILLLIYTSWARALYVFVPFFVIVALKSLDRFFQYLKINNIFIFITFIANVIVVLFVFMKTTSYCENNRSLYHEINNYIRMNVLNSNKKISVGTRDTQIRIDSTNINICENYFNCKKTEYFVLSNIKSNFMDSPKKFEKDNINFQRFEYNEEIYELTRVNSCGKGYVKLYEKVVNK